MGEQSAVDIHLDIWQSSWSCQMAFTSLLDFPTDGLVRLLLQVVPALDPETPIYSGGFAMQLIKRRMQEYSLWNESRFKTFKMNERFQLGPFE